MTKATKKMAEARLEVRLPEQELEDAKKAAELDGFLSLSQWIRTVVRKAARKTLERDAGD